MDPQFQRPQAQVRAVMGRNAASGLPGDDKADHVNDFGLGWGTSTVDGVTPEAVADNPSRLGPEGNRRNKHERYPDRRDAASQVPRGDKGGGGGRWLEPMQVGVNQDRWTNPSEGVDYQNRELYDEPKYKDSKEAGLRNNPLINNGLKGPNSFLEGREMSARSIYAKAVAGEFMFRRADKLNIDPNLAKTLGEGYTQLERKIELLKAQLNEVAGDIVAELDTAGKNLKKKQAEIIALLESSGADIRALKDHTYTVGNAVFGFKRVLGSNPPADKVLKKAADTIGKANADIIAQIIEMEKQSNPKLKDFQVMMVKRPRKSARQVIALQEKYAGTKRAGIMERLEEALAWWKGLYQKFSGFLSSFLGKAQKADEVISKRSREIIDTLREARAELAKLEASA